MPLILIDITASPPTVRAGSPDADQQTMMPPDALVGDRVPAGDRLAVQLEPDQDPAVVAACLERIDVIELVWQKFTDGRGFSQARQLREMGYEGQIRASGDILPDQIAFLARCGVDAVAFDAGQGDAVDVARAALEEIPVLYQSLSDRRPTAARLRLSHPDGMETPERETPERETPERENNAL